MHLSAIIFYQLWLGQNSIPAMMHALRDYRDGLGGKILTFHAVAGLGLLSICLVRALLAIILKPSVF